MPSRDDAIILLTGPSERGWHRLQQGFECLQKYAWHYKAPKVLDDQGKPVGEAKADRPALAKGSLLHLAMAQHYARMRERQNGRDEEAYCDPMEAVHLVAKMDKTEQFVADIERTFEAYVDEFWADEQQYRILEVEELNRTTVGGKYLLTGRFDLVLEDGMKRVFVCDHKSTGRIQPAQKEFYNMSGQFLAYGLMARQKYGDRFAGVKINLVQVGAKPAFLRVDLGRSPHLEAHFEQSVVDLEQIIERLEAEGRPYDQWPKSMNELTCYHRYGACEHMDKCRFGVTGAKAGNWSFDFHAK